MRNIATYLRYSSLNHNNGCIIDQSSAIIAYAQKMLARYLDEEDLECNELPDNDCGEKGSILKQCEQELSDSRSDESQAQ